MTTYYAIVSRDQESPLKHTYRVEADSIDRAVVAVRAEASQSLIQAAHRIWIHELAVFTPPVRRPEPTWSQGNLTWEVEHTEGWAWFCGKSSEQDAHLFAIGKLAK